MNQLTRRGLIGYWDVGNKLSYPGSGTTVTDLSKNVNASVVGSLTYSSNNWGSLAYPGSGNNSIKTPATTASDIYNASNGYSLIILLKTSTSLTSSDCPIFSRYDGTSGFDLFIRSKSSFSNASSFASASTFTDGNWHTIMRSVTKNSPTSYTYNAYYDGVLVLTESANAIPSINSGTQLVIGALLNTNSFLGSVGCAAFYNLGITSQEVKINHNYLKKRTLHP